MHFIKLIKQYKELALTARDTGKLIERRVVTTWKHGGEDLSEWSERKGDDLYHLDGFYERGVVRLKGLLVELIKTSDQPLTVNINWEDVVALGLSFHKIL